MKKILQVIILLLGLVAGTSSPGAVHLQLAMILDGSGSISSSNWQVMLEGLAGTIEDPSCLPHDATTELTVVQFARSTGVVEVGPVVIGPGNVAAVAGQIRAISHEGGNTPMATGIKTAADALAGSPHFSPAAKQALNLVTDGEPTWSDPHFSPAGPNYHENTVAARDYAISLLQLTADRDEFDIEVIDNAASDINWLKDSLVFPQPGYLAPPFTGPGWVRVVTDFDEFAATLCEKFSVVIPPTPAPTSTPDEDTTPLPPPTFTPTPAPIPIPTSTPSYSYWYLPAGGTEINGFDFDEIVSLTNPTAEHSAIEITAVDELGVITRTGKTIAPESRYTVTLDQLVRGTRGEKNDSVSLIIRDLNDRVIMVDRSMYWNPGGVSGGGGHNTVGINERNPWWYLPEGATHVFDQYIHVLNPDRDFPALVTVTFMNMAGRTWTVQTTIGPESNWTIHANEHVTIPGSIATTVESMPQAGHDVQSRWPPEGRVPVVADRTLYWDTFWNPETDIRWADGHASRGTTRQSTRWYIAEGATHHIFDCFILIMNPSPTETAEAEVTFMDAKGGVQVENYTIPPHTRETIWVNQVMTYRGSFSAEIESTNGVYLMVERAMYWSAEGIQWAGGHDSIGAIRLAPVWYLPEGRTDIFDEWILLGNPDPVRDAEVDVTFFFETETPNTVTVSVPARQRVTVHANDYHVTDAVSVRVEETTVPFSGKLPIIAERAMYWNPPAPGGVYWGGGHATIGIPVWTEGK